jgi:hypothetical protein
LVAIVALPPFKDYCEMPFTQLREQPYGSLAVIQARWEFAGLKTISEHKFSERESSSNELVELRKQAIASRKKHGLPTFSTENYSPGSIPVDIP